MTTDQENVNRMLEGDEAAFEQLFDTYHKKLYRMAYLISGNHADSEDIVQETFLKCYLNRSKLKDSACFEGWLCRILTRTAWKIGKSSKREEPVEELWKQKENGYQQGPLEALLNNQQRESVWEAVKRLPVKQRTAVVLYYYNQLSAKEVAKAMGCLEGTVKSRLHTARKNLERILPNEAKEETLWKKKSLTL